MSALPTINPEYFVYMWADGSWCFDDELEEHLMFLQSDDFRKVCLGEPDYPEELRG